MHSSVTGPAILAGLFATIAGCGGGGAGGGAAPVSLGTPVAVDADIRNLPQLTQLAVGSTAGIAARTQPGGAVTLSASSLPSQFSITSVGGTITSMTLRVPALAIGVSFAAADISSSEWTPGSGVLSAEAGRTLGRGSVGLVAFHPGPASLQYHTLGLWVHVPDPSGTDLTAGFFTAGTLTAPSDIPATGTATYTGIYDGNILGPNRFDTIDGLATATADFGARSVALSTSQSFRQDLIGTASPRVAAPELDMTGTLAWQPGTNSLVGTVTNGAGFAGSAQAAFFGPQAAEIGGTFQWIDGGSNHGAGVFGVHR